MKTNVFFCYQKPVACALSYYYHALTYWGGVPLLQDEITSLDQVKNVKKSHKG